MTLIRPAPGESFQSATAGHDSTEIIDSICDAVETLEAAAVSLDGVAVTTAAFGDVAASGSGTVVAKRNHVHGMMANPVTAHEAAVDPHTGYTKESDLTVLAPGANDTILMADSGVAGGFKWAASATPSTQAFGDVATIGTADTFTRGDHKHAMPAHTVFTTRRIYLPSHTFTGGGGESTSGTSPNAVTVLQLPDAATTGVLTSFIYPADAVNGGSFTMRPLVVAGATVAAGTVRWRETLHPLVASTVAAAGTQVSWTGDSAARTAGVSWRETGTPSSPAFTPSIGEVVRVCLERLGADAADTLATNVYLVGIEIDYTSVT
jgi:hypothetical protein